MRVEMTRKQFLKAASVLAAGMATTGVVGTTLLATLAEADEERGPYRCRPAATVGASRQAGFHRSAKAESDIRGNLVAAGCSGRASRTRYRLPQLQWKRVGGRPDHRLRQRLRRRFLQAGVAEFGATLLRPRSQGRACSLHALWAQFRRPAMRGARDDQMPTPPSQHWIIARSLVELCSDR